MRLPALTTRQQQQEDARIIHEQLYAAYNDSSATRVVLMPGREGVKRFQAKVSGNYRRFWNERGFLLKTRTQNDLLLVWIEPMGAVHLKKAEKVA